MFYRATSIVPVLVLAALFPACAAEKRASELELKTERVIIFKDGYSLIIKRGTATSDKAGEVFTDEVPDAAVLGSFWATPDQGRLISMVAGWKTTKDSAEKQLPCTQLLEILLANKGKSAKIELHDKAIFSGVIREVLVDKSEAAVPAAQFELLDLASPTATKPSPAILPSRVSRLVPEPSTAVHTLTTVSGSNFVLRTDEGDVLLPVTQVRTISVKDMQTTLAKTLTTTKRTKRLSFKLEGAEKKQSLAIMYFRPGIRWIPTYRVSLSDKQDKKATISLQAELLNEAEDLEDVPVDIVVGVPNFRFRGTPSPLVLEATLRNALAEAAPDLMGNGSQQFSNAMYSQRSGEFRREQAGANAGAQGTINLPGELTGTGAQDLFVYSLPKLTLGHGERIAVPIFTAETTYRDIYTWEVHATKTDNAAAPSGSGAASPLTLSKNEVWHQIMLTNNTSVPWTTGAVMIMQGNQPLAQELLTYTPPKDEVRVPVTVSVDTRGSLTEKETSRELKSLTWDGYNYARIDREMKLDLCNNKALDIEAEITLRVGGKATKATHDGSITLGDFNPADWVQYRGQPAVNNSSTIVWKVKLKPGDNFEPSVQYHHFTRH
ncbi:hypothetical protein ETAA8_70340 [Anatilimnocola aggregata]|uniref:DUF4139 domain-containing protein n=1 Tax=Anatilimnocola aggregata TaxID=2528021 RepID=A0A517YNS1_9BACT|nr:hypothetical protein [Anatilimnocola aggregata]QDU31873.1 hypothetical protein ETAA8_70340 [Anatilimnocola aggregata]